MYFGRYPPFLLFFFPSIKISFINSGSTEGSADSTPCSVRSSSFLVFYRAWHPVPKNARQLCCLPLNFREVLSCAELF